MKLLFYLGHPAHYLNVSVVIDHLARRGHRILLVAREKDVLFDLIKDLPYPKKLLRRRKSERSYALYLEVIKREAVLLQHSLLWWPDLLIGTDIAITHIGKLLGIPSLVLNEDDAAAVPLFARYGLKYATHILAPHCCDSRPHEHKKVGYQGFQELAYLHPKYFFPDRNKVKGLYKGRERYFILRFSALNAHHDSGRSGLTRDIAGQVIELLEPHGSVHITSERPLEPEFEPYRIRINPRDIHHALFFAHLYVGDSQTMTAESAVLGTPAIRFNDFVGELSYLEELERTYGLTYGIRTNEPQRLLNTLQRLLDMPDLKSSWQERRRQMLERTIDVAAFFSWFIENYPVGAAQAAEKQQQLKWHAGAGDGFEGEPQPVFLNRR